MKHAAIILASTLLAASGAARADSITVKLPYGEGIVITDVKDCSVFFRLPTMRQIIQSAAEIREVSVSGVPELDAAEKLVKARQLDQALTAYEQLARKGAPDGKPWLPALVWHRLHSAALRAGRTDYAVMAWLALMDANDASEPTIALRPELPKEKGEMAERCIELLSAKSGVTNAAYRQAVDPFLMKLLQLQGRDAEAAALAEKISKAVRPDTTSESGRVAFVSKIEAAEQFLKINQPDKTVATLQPLMNQFNESELVRALLVVAQAQSAMAKTAPDEQRHALLCQAALNAMRVLLVSQAGEEDKARALYLAAAVNESFKKPNTVAAKKCYDRILKDFPRTAVSTAARQALARLEK